MRENEFEPDNFLSSLFVTAKQVIFSPRRFYEGMKMDGGLRNPFIFLVSCVLVHTVTVGIIHKSHAMAMINLATGLVMPAVTAGILFFIITRVFKVPGTFETAFRVNAYSAAPPALSGISILGGGLALLGLLLELYRIYLIVLGLSCTYRVKTSRALLAVVITLFTYMGMFWTIAHIAGFRLPTAAP